MSTTTPDPAPLTVVLFHGAVTQPEAVADVSLTAAAAVDRQTAAARG